MKAKPPEFLDVLADYFNNYLPLGIGLSQNTITSYDFVFGLLFDYLENVRKIGLGKITFATLSGGVITDFLYWLETERKCSPKTRNQRRSALLSFAKYAVKKNAGGGAALYTEVKTSPKRKIPKNTDFKYFSRDEIAVLLALPSEKTKIGYRDKILLSTLYATGARAQEICDLMIDDIRFGSPTSIKLTGKGGKSRVITVPENSAAMLKTYINSYRMPMINGSEGKYVFRSQTHVQMSISCVEEIVKKYLTSAKQQNPSLFPAKGYSPHSFRHSIAVHMLESGIPLPVIKTFLGHESIATTMQYAEVTPELANKYLENHASLTNSADSTSIQAFSERLPFLQRHLNRNR